MKIGTIPILAFGLLVSVSMLSWAFFYHWQPNTTEIAAYKQYRDDLTNQLVHRDAAVKRVQGAEAMVLAQAAQWRTIALARTPGTSVKQGGIDLAVNGFQLPTDAVAFRNNMQRAINRQLKAGGVTVVNGPSLPMPPQDPQAILTSYFNYPAVPFPVVIFDLGPVTVEGTFAQIAANMRSWSSMPNYLAVADRLRLQGTSPKLTGTYDLTIVGYIRSTSPLFPPIPTDGTVLAMAAPDPNAPAPNSAPAPARPQGGAPQ